MGGYAYFAINMPQSQVGELEGLTEKTDALRVGATKRDGHMLYQVPVAHVPTFEAEIRQKFGPDGYRVYNRWYNGIFIPLENFVIPRD